MAVANMAMVMISSILSPRRPLLAACFILLSPFLIPIFVVSFPFVLTTSVFSMCFLRCARFVLRLGFSRFSTAKRRIAAQGLRSGHRRVDHQPDCLAYDEFCHSDRKLGFPKDKNSIFSVNGGTPGFPEDVSHDIFINGERLQLSEENLYLNGKRLELSEGKPSLIYVNGERFELSKGRSSGILVNGERIRLSESKRSQIVANGGRVVQFPARNCTVNGSRSSFYKLRNGRVSEFFDDGQSEEDEDENRKSLRVHEYLEDQLRSLDNMQAMALSWRSSNDDEDLHADYNVIDDDEYAGSNGCFSVHNENMICNGDGEDPPLPCSFSPMPCLVD